MARVSSTAASTLGSGVKTLSIQNIAVTATTEEAVSLPSGTRRFVMKMRDVSSFEVRASAGALEFYSVCPGNDYTEVDLSPTNDYTIYITPYKSGVLEVLSWS